MRLFSVLFIFLSLSFSASAEIHTEVVEYKHGDVALEGYLAYDNSSDDTRPAVMVIHEWTGIGDYVKMRVKKLAEMGYVAFACDIYGKGVRPDNPQDASKQATIYRSNRALMRARAQAGLNILQNHELVQKDKIAAIGYCFGGGVALELARSGVDITGAVSFHGNLDTPDINDAKNIKAKILVCHGGADSHVPIDQVEAFWHEMNEAHVDWQFIAYGNAVHSFTNPSSGDDPSRGVAYDENADKRSWAAMKSFFVEIFN